MTPLVIVTSIGSSAKQVLYQQCHLGSLWPAYERYNVQQSPTLYALAVDLQDDVSRPYADSLRRAAFDRRDDDDLARRVNLHVRAYAFEIAAEHVPKAGLHGRRLDVGRLRIFEHRQHPAYGACPMAPDSSLEVSTYSCEGCPMPPR